MTPSTETASHPTLTFIDVTEPRHILFWTREFGVSEMQLRYAVAAAGESLQDIRDYLGVK